MDDLAIFSRYLKPEFYDIDFSLEAVGKPPVKKLTVYLGKLKTDKNAIMINLSRNEKLTKIN